MPVVDASVVVDWVAPDVDPGSAAMEFLDRLAKTGEPLVAPRLLLEEVANALLSGVRRRRWTGAAADRAQGLAQRLPLEILDDRRDLERAWELARRFDNHPIYDMVYVALAERRGLRLITADAALRDRLTSFDWVVTPDQR